MDGLFTFPEQWFYRANYEENLWLIFLGGSAGGFYALYICTGNNPLIVTMFDVGQAKLGFIFIRKTAVIDCGGNRMKNAGDIASEYNESWEKETGHAYPNPLPQRPYKRRHSDAERLDVKFCPARHIRP